MSEPARDVFIIHTKADDQEAALVEGLKRELFDWGLSPWVYEDWEWATTVAGRPTWRSSGANPDLVRFLLGDPQPFKHRTEETQPDREALTNIYSRSQAIVLIAPRSGVLSDGAYVELEALRETEHPPVVAVSWGPQNRSLLREVPAFFEYPMSALSESALAIARESIARASWLACMVDGLVQCGPMGLDLVRQLARADGLLNKLARRRPRPIEMPLEVDPKRGAELSREATVENCLPVVDLWEGGPGFTADQRTSGKPPQEIIQASKEMRYHVGHWVRLAQERFPTLKEPTAARFLSLGAAKMRAGRRREAIDALTVGLGASDAGKLRSALLVNRALTWSQMGFDGKALADLSAIIAEADANDPLLTTARYNRALALQSAGKDAEAESDLDAVIAGDNTNLQTRSLALKSRARLRFKRNAMEEALADFDAIIAESKAPAEARLQAHLNRGVTLDKLGRHVEAIQNHEAVLGDRAATPRQVSLALYNRAHAWEVLGDAPRARADFEKVLAQSDVDADLRARAEEKLVGLPTAAQ